MLHGCSIDLAGLATELSADDPRVAEALAAVLRRARPTAEPPLLRVRAQVEAPGVPPGAPEQSTEEFDTWRPAAGELVVRHRSGLTARATSTTVDIGGSAPRFDENFRRTVLPALAHTLACHDRHVVHGAALAVGGSAILVLGDTRAGKSTLAWCARVVGWDVLADDLVVLRDGGAGPALAGVPRPLAVPSDVLPDSGGADGTRALPGDARARREPSPDLVAPGWFAVTGSIAVAHSPDARGAVEPLPGHALLRRLLASWSPLEDPGGLRAVFPLAAAVARRPAAVVTLGRDPATARRRRRHVARRRLPSFRPGAMTTPGAIELRVMPPRREHGRLHLAAELRNPDGSVEEIFFSIDEYERDALVDRADPFVVATVPLAMRRGHEIRVVGAAVSPSLLDSLERFQEVWHDWYEPPIVDIVAEEERELGTRPQPAVAAFSGGVDSAFTAYRHTRGVARRDRHLTAAVMIHGVDIPRVNVPGFVRSAARSRRMVESVGLDLVTVQTNLWEIVSGRWYPIAAGLSSVLHLLGARFGAGLIPGTTSYRHLVFPLGSSPVSDVMLGSTSFEIVHDGAGVERFEKLRHLASWDEALDDLRVCLSDPQHHRNCGHCLKCMLTILSFRVLDVTPRCFESPPSEAEILEWVPSLPSHPVYVQEAQTLVDEAAARGVDERWVRVMRRKLRVIHAKQGIRTIAPAWSDRATAAHRWVDQRRRNRRR